MEEDNRHQKLKAGKEKLAQFQRKKKKKGRGEDETSKEEQVGLTDVAILQGASSMEAGKDPEGLQEETIVNPAASDLSAQPTHTIMSSSSKYVINNNQALPNSTTDQSTSFPVIANDNQSIINTDAVNGTQSTKHGSQPVVNGNQEFTMDDVRELMYNIQWLQSQLRQSSATLKSQTDQQKVTMQALETANNKIAVLQTNIDEKDNLLENLAKKLTHISHEYTDLKHTYAKLQSDPNTSAVKIEAKTEADASDTSENKTETLTQQKETQCELEDNNNELKTLKETIDELHQSLEHANLEREKLQVLSEELMEQNDNLTQKCDTLTKGLQFSKEEHEKAEEEATHLKSIIQQLQKDHDELIALKNDCEHTILALNEDLKQSDEDRKGLEEEMSQLNENNKELQEQLKKSGENVADKLNEIETLKSTLVELNRNLESEMAVVCNLSRENENLSEDNAHYKKQVTEYENKVSEMCDVSEENHSLRLQNDDLNNKINDQKDVIAALKSDNAILTQENSNFNESLDILTASVKSFEMENTELNREKIDLTSNLADLRSKLLAITDENDALKGRNLVLCSEIDTLKTQLKEDIEFNNKSIEQGEGDNSIKEIKEMSIQPVIQRQTMVKSMSRPDTCDDQSHSNDIDSRAAVEETIEAQIIVDNQMAPEERLSESENETSENLSLQTPLDINDDTAYDSLQQTVDSFKPGTKLDNSDSVDTMIKQLQDDHQTTKEALLCKMDECEKCHEEIQSLKHQVNLLTNGNNSSEPLTMSDIKEIDSEMDNVCKDSDNNNQEVSHIPSGAQEKEVNLHASSSPSCHINTVVSLDSCSVGNVVAGDSSVVDVGEETSTFQDFSDSAVLFGADHGDAKSDESKSDVNSGKSFLRSETIDNSNDSLETENTKLREQCRELSEAMKENEIVLCNKLTEEKRKNEQLCKDKESMLLTLTKLQYDFDEAKLTHENLKRDHDNLSNKCDIFNSEQAKLSNKIQELESQNVELKTAKCDIELQKEHVVEELSQVNDRLEYLKASDNDLNEIKDLVDKLQVEREAITNQNEKLQCSLSSQLLENEKLVDTLATLQRENSVLLENLTSISGKDEELVKEIKEIQSRKLELENEVEALIKSSSLDYHKFTGEIEGLVEENSTLKTNVQIKQTEIEHLQEELENMNSVMQTTDKVNKDANVLTTMNNELEKKLEDISRDNENLVSEVMEFQKKFKASEDEKESLFEKCEEYQNIINDLDNEKTELLENVAKNKAQAASTSQEHGAQLEKYEMQLESLDQENSTLKTLLLQLEDENKVNKTANSELEMVQSENVDLQSKLNSLESQIEQSNSDISNITHSLNEKDEVIQTLSCENELVKEKNSNLTKDLKHVEEKVVNLEEKVKYLNEQIKVYEEKSESETTTTNNERLYSEQLELEKKYKIKLQNDIEKLHSNLEGLETGNRELTDMNDRSKSEKQELQRHLDQLKLKDVQNCSEISKLEDDKSKLREEKQELKSEIQICCAENSKFKAELNEMKTTLQFMAANRDHLRTQIEILAAEVEQVCGDRNGIMLQYNEKDLICHQLQYEQNELKEAMMTVENDLTVCLKEKAEIQEQFEAEIEKLLDENEQLKCDVGKLNEQNDTLRKTVQTNQESLKMDQEILVENEKLCEENKKLLDENECLQHENQEFKDNALALKERVLKMAEVLDEYRNREHDDESISEQIKELNKKAAQVQKEKEHLQHLTEDLSNTLQDMQTKYEDVQSEMEYTKKRCDKDIVELQSKLKDMNEAVKELRRLLDYMENEMLKAADKEKAFHAKLESQEKELSVVKEQKSKLEAMLDVKQQKDLKNMKMVTENQGSNNAQQSSLDNSTAASNRSDVRSGSTQEDSGLDQDAVEQLAEAITAMSESLSDLNETYEIFEDEDPEPVIPSFERAYELFNLQSCEDTSSKLVQTNLTVGEFEAFGVMLDDNGSVSENGKDKSVESVGVQTDCSCLGTESEKSLEAIIQRVSNGLKTANGETQKDIKIKMVTSSNQGTQTSLDQEIVANIELNMDSEGIIHPDIGEQLNMYEELTFPLTVCSSLPQELDIDSVHKMKESKTIEINNDASDKTLDNLIVQEDGNQESEQGNTIKPNESELGPKSEQINEQEHHPVADLSPFSGNLTMLSVDSGIMSAPVVLDDRNLYKFDGHEHERGNRGNQKSVEHTMELETKVKNDVPVFTDSEVQTDFDIEQEIAERITKFEEKFQIDMAEIEAKIENKVLKKLEFRESAIYSKEENYERKIKNIEFELEEKYEHRFREREIEVVIQGEKEKKAHAEQVERDANRKIERIRIEKDQQFVETLQKVKADYEKKTRKKKCPKGDGELVIQDVTSRDSDRGPDGDNRTTLTANQMHILKVENQELASVRDELLRKVQASEQEQEDIYLQLIDIMGDQGSIGNTSPRQPRNPQLPSWLDWEMSPELSFDSVRSSNDTKSLSDSLDPSLFCSNQDCLNIRSKYEHLVEKMQQFLQMKSPTVSLDTLKVPPDETSSNSNHPEAATDRFVENEEPESQMLQRLTSIHLEHFVRIPKNDDVTDGVNDQFVQESFTGTEVDGSQTVSQGDVLRMIIKSSNENVEGHFSENELDDEDDDVIGETMKGKVSAKSYSAVPKKEFAGKVRDRSVSSCDDDGHFSEEEGALNDTIGRKRHFSDTELTQDNLKNKSNVQSSQSDASEGQFVLEQSVRNESDPEEVEEMITKEQVTGIKANSGFIVDEKPPGKGGMTVHLGNQMKTGKETGDFFEENAPDMGLIRRQSSDRQRSKSYSENISDDERFDSGDILEQITHEKTDDKQSTGKHVHNEHHSKDIVKPKTLLLCKPVITEILPVNKPHWKGHRRNYSEGDVVGRSQSLRRDFNQAEAVLEADLSENKTSFNMGKQNYENAVFDILNSICPGTDPNRRPAVRKPADTFQPTVETPTATAKEFSDVPKDVDIKLKYDALKKQFDELQKEFVKKASNEKSNEEITNALKKLEKENKMLMKKCQKSQAENTKMKEDIKKVELEFSDIVQKYGSIDIEQHEELKKENEKLKHEVTLVNEDIKFVTEEIDRKVIEFEKLQETLKNSESLKETLNKKMQQIEAEKIDLEKQLGTESDNLKEEILEIKDTVNLLKDTNAKLECDIEKLTAENEHLKELDEKHSKLLTEQNDLMFQISQLQDERTELLKIIEEDKGKVLEEKNELEKALLAHDDMNRQLEMKIDEVKAENLGLNELLNIERQLKLDSKEINDKLKIKTDELNSKVTELENEKRKLDEETKDHVDEILHLKKEKDELNEKVKTLQADNKSLKDNLTAKANQINDLTRLNENLNGETKKLTEEVKEFEPQLSNLKREILNLTYANKQLTKQNVNVEDKLYSSIDETVQTDIEMIPTLPKVKSVDQSTETNDLVDDFMINVPKHESMVTDETGSSFTVSMDTNHLFENQGMLSLKEELEMLKTENVALKERIDSFDARSDSDTDMQILQDMREAIQTLKTEKAAMERQKSEVSDTLETDQKRLQSEMEELLAENDALRKGMKVKEDTLKKENSEILKMYNDLRNEVEVLVISKHDLEVEIHALKGLLDQESATIHEKFVEHHDTSKELTLEDLEQMADLKSSIEKLKTDLKEKDSYVRKLEEHLLGSERGVPMFSTTPRPLLSRGNPLLSKAVVRRSSFTGQTRKAFSHDVPLNPIEDERQVIGATQSEIDQEAARPVGGALKVEELDSSISSENRFVEELGKLERGLTSSLMSSTGRSSNASLTLDASERIRSGLRADEDGHLALELKQFELVAEITKLRRDLRETKAVYAQETSLLSEALEQEKLSKDYRSRAESLSDHSLSSNISHDLLKLRKEVALLREDNRLLRIDNDRWLERLKEQETIVSDMKERLGRNTSGYDETEEVFGRQLALLQKQREELVDKLQNKEYQISNLSLEIGEKGILEETLRKEKSILMRKLEDREKLEKELQDKKFMLEKQTIKQRELEDVLYRKDLNEIELMKQKRLLEEEIRDIESKFRDKEETLDYEKHKLLDELREKHNRSRSQFSDSTDDVSSTCSESAAHSDRNVGRLELMLEEVERQHARAVNVLKDQMRTKYQRREKELRQEHAAGLTRLKTDTNRQVN